MMMKNRGTKGVSKRPHHTQSAEQDPRTGIHCCGVTPVQKLLLSRDIWENLSGFLRIGNVLLWIFMKNFSTASYFDCSDSVHSVSYIIIRLKEFIYLPKLWATLIDHDSRAWMSSRGGWVIQGGFSHQTHCILHHTINHPSIAYADYPYK